MDIVIHREVSSIHYPHVHTKLRARQSKVRIPRNTPNQGLANLICLGPAENTSGHGLCCLVNTAHAIHEWLWLCSSKILRSEIGSRPELVCRLANPCPRQKLVSRETGVSPYLDCMVEENPMHCFSNGIHSSEGEGQVGKTTTYSGSR